MGKFQTQKLNKRIKTRNKKQLFFLLVKILSAPSRALASNIEMKLKWPKPSKI
jgi:hypothetical protein